VHNPPRASELADGAAGVFIRSWFAFSDNRNMFVKQIWKSGIVRE